MWQTGNAPGCDPGVVKTNAGSNPVVHPYMDIVEEAKKWVEEKYHTRGHKTGEIIRSLIEEIEKLRLAKPVEK